MNSRPQLQFIGDLFEYDVNYNRIMNYFFDFFVANIEIESLDISKEFTHVIQFLATETKIVMKTYQIEMNQEAIENKSLDEGIAELTEVEPHIEFELKRHQFAN